MRGRVLSSGWKSVERERAAFLIICQGRKRLLAKTAEKAPGRRRGALAAGLTGADTEQVSDKFRDRRTRLVAGLQGADARATCHTPTPNPDPHPRLIPKPQTVMAYQHYSAAKQCIYSFMDNVRGLAMQMQVTNCSLSWLSAPDLVPFLYKLCPLPRDVNASQSIWSHRFNETGLFETRIAISTLQIIHVVDDESIPASPRKRYYMKRG